MPRSQEPPASPAPGLCYRRGPGGRSAPECVLRPRPEVGGPRRVRVPRESGCQARRGRGSWRSGLMTGRSGGGRPPLCWGRRARAAQPGRAKVGQSYSCARGSPASPAPGPVGVPSSDLGVGAAVRVAGAWGYFIRVDLELHGGEGGGTHAHAHPGGFRIL